MIVDGKRALAYIVKVDSITPIEGADNIEMAHVGGWNVIIKKQEYQPGDLAVFCEIDSKLPEKEWSEFLRPKKFKVKTYRLGKFNAISQGLLLPLDILPKGAKQKINEDVTELLGITYSVEEDNQRKGNGNPNEKYERMAARRKKLSKKKWFKWMMRREWGRKILFLLFGKKKDMPKKFPAWIRKTDEERVENMVWILENREPWIKTEKIDGTSTTVFLDLTGKAPDFGVCSRNVRQMDVNQRNWHTAEGVDNVYWEMAMKYGMREALEKIAEENSLQRVVLQGETYGAAIQGNPYKLAERRFAAFNLIFDGERLGSLEAKELLDRYGIPFVPIIEKGYTLPSDFEEFKLTADGKSEVNPNCRREGFVYRSLDGRQSFKNVSREYLLKKE